MPLNKTPLTKDGFPALAKVWERFRVKGLFFPGVLVMVAAWSGPASAMDCRRSAEDYERAKSAGDRQARIQWLQRSIEACPNFNAWYMLGRLYSKQGRLDQASHAFAQARAVSATPQADALALGRQGEVLAQGGQRHQALRALELADQFHPPPAPDWLAASLKAVRIQSHRQVMAAAEIVAYLNPGDAIGKNSRFSVRPAVNLPVHFEFDRADLNASGSRQMLELGRALSVANLRQASFLLVGHTDKRGSRPYNQMLSERRAHTVKMELERRFPTLIGKLKATGRGETQLLYDGDDETDHMLNRRVKITLIP
ncbi:MAG: OmpA family protein [Desulfobacterales bacterium]|nr:OmpA family protein [Desulfobacterales bacterium]